METINEFRKQQAQTLDVLERLLDFLKEGKRCGVNIDPALIRNLETGIKATAEEKLNVAVIGVINVGKTSIIAAWAEKYDKTTMKIDRQESSDKVNVYSLEDFNIIDTPGLFGFKKNADKEEYKNITRKYVSQAHIVLYVMYPTNPVRDEHKEELIWLFKDLKLLPRTVFVLNRFDDVIDIEDDADYGKKLKIKQQNVIGRLQNFGIIKNDDIPDITIVAVSADPNEKGSEYWLSHLDKFRRLSRIDSLQKATTEKIKSAGTNTALMEELRKSIAIDVLKRELPVAVERDKKAKLEYDRFKKVCDDAEKDCIKIRSDLGEIRIALRNNIERIFTNLIEQTKGLSIETIVAFFQREIGDEGIKLTTKIQNEFEMHLEGGYHEINRIQISIDEGIQQYVNVTGNAIADYAKESLKSVGKFSVSAGLEITVEIVKKGVQDIIIPLFKFKPWKAIKLAHNVNVLPIIGATIGIAFTLKEIHDEAREEKEFNEGINNMVSLFEQQKKEYMDFFDDEDKFMQECFLYYISLRKQLEELQKELQEKQKQHENFKNWLKMGKEIEKQLKLNL